MDDPAVETQQADLRRWNSTVEDVNNKEDQCTFEHPRNPACIVKRSDGSDDDLDGDVPKVTKAHDDNLEMNMDVDGVEESPEMADEELGASLLFLVAFSHGEQLVD